MLPGLHCPEDPGIALVQPGLSPASMPRSRCRACLEGRGRTFVLASSDAGPSPEVKQQSVDRALNARGRRESVRVLHVSSTTVLNA